MARRPRERRAAGAAAKARKGRTRGGSDGSDSEGGRSPSPSPSPPPSSSSSDSDADLREEERDDARREAALREQLERMKQLPKASRYARHRIKQITTCLDLIARRKRTRQQRDLLSRLLGELNVL